MMGDVDISLRLWLEYLQWEVEFDGMDNCALRIAFHVPVTAGRKSRIIVKR